VTRDGAIEIALTVSALMAVAAFIAFHHGAARATPQTLQLPSVPDNQQNLDALNWNPDQNFANAWPSDDITVVGTNVPPAIYNISAPAAVGANPINLSSGFPQCGCTHADITDISGAIAQQSALFASLANAIIDLPRIIPVVPVTLNINQIQRLSPFGLPQSQPNVEQLGDGLIIYNGGQSATTIGA
jgi:hypothetical protein